MDKKAILKLLKKFEKEESKAKKTKWTKTVTIEDYMDDEHRLSVGVALGHFFTSRGFLPGGVMHPFSTKLKGMNLEVLSLLPIPKIPNEIFLLQSYINKRNNLDLVQKEFALKWDSLEETREAIVEKVGGTTLYLPMFHNKYNLTELSPLQKGFVDWYCNTQKDKKKMTEVWHTIEKQYYSNRATLRSTEQVYVDLIFNEYKNLLKEKAS